MEEEARPPGFFKFTDNLIECSQHAPRIEDQGFESALDGFMLESVWRSVETREAFPLLSKGCDDSLVECVVSGEFDPDDVELDAAQRVRLAFWLGIWIERCAGR